VIGIRKQPFQTISGANMMMQIRIKLIKKESQLQGQFRKSYRHSIADVAAMLI